MTSSSPSFQFDYALPEELIAQTPLADRAGARMLVLFRNQARWEDRVFREFPGFLGRGDCLVLNDSKVFPSRLYGRRAGGQGGRAQVFLLRPVSGDSSTWEALVRPGSKLRTGEVIRFDAGLEARIVARGEYGARTVRFEPGGDIFEKLEEIGRVPLPPYIRRPDTPEDRERYQTVYARERGSAAAPTAGLHFTPEILAECQAAGAEIARVTLHVGLGTFAPLREEQIAAQHLHSEPYAIAEDSAARMRSASRLVAVGTTSVRAIETALPSGKLSGDTDLFIQPGFQFTRTGALLTNFHLPRTSLLRLVCAFGGTELVLAAYRHAIGERYRFYSYGDCMLIV